MASVDGLVTGLDTTTIISQLLQLEAAPQTRLKNQVSAQQTVQGAYQTVNARMMAVRNAAQALTTAATWQAVTATSSSDAVTASTGATGRVGTATFDVVSLAKTHVVTSAVPGSGSLTTGGSLTLTVGGGTPVPITVSTDTAQGVADAVNGANAGVVATVVSTTGGQVLQFSATASGAAKTFTLTGLTASTTVLTAGADAEIKVGDPSAGGYRMTSANNIFTGLVPGVTVRANRVESGVTVTSTPDVGKLADAMQTLVSAVNATLTEIVGRSTYNATTKVAGPLNADGLTRSLRTELLGGVSGGVSGASLSTLGVQLERTGTLVFDRQKFIAAYQADPTGVQTKVSDGFAKTYQTIATQATDPTIGRLTQAVQGVESSVRRMTDEIRDWDVRLAAKKISLQRQYTGLETALGKLKDQSSWLAGQLASLPTGASS